MGATSRSHLLELNLQEGGRGSQEKDNELIQDKTELGESSSFLSKKRL